jgi:protein disulfide-isomerase
MDLGRYVDVLDLALEGVRPVSEVLAGMRADPAMQLGAAECRRLAYNGWGLDPRATEDPRGLVASLVLAAQRCPVSAAVERDRLAVMAAGLAAANERADVAAGKAASPQLRPLLDAVDALLADPARSQRVADALLDLGDDFFVVTRLLDPQRIAMLQQRWYALMDAIEGDTNYSDTVRLASAGGRLMAAKALDAKEAIPAPVAAKARNTLDAFLARSYDADARSGVVNSASWVLGYLGDDAGLRKLLEGEISTSRTAYYYMPDLADLEEKAGNKDQALFWLQRAYAESRGPATRFQWGVLYLEGLLRISPQDEPRIRAAALEVLGELAGPDRIHARALTRLNRVNDGLHEWARKSGHKDTLATIARRWQQICAAVPASDPASGSCRGLLTAGA